VLEDYARFNADDRHLTTLLKQSGHEPGVTDLIAMLRS